MFGRGSLSMPKRSCALLVHRATPRWRGLSLHARSSGEPGSSRSTDDRRPSPLSDRRRRCLRSEYRLCDVEQDLRQRSRRVRDALQPRYLHGNQARGNQFGKPDFNHISTSYVERQNLTMRMSMRRFTRLTNGHSKKLENHGHAIAIHYMYYNFARIHQTLRVTPAMEAGISDHVWSIEEIIGLLESNHG
jgi:hypothetical protein